MKETKKQNESTEVMVRVYDLFGGIDALWVLGYPIERTKTKYLDYYEFKIDTMLPATIHIANSCEKPVVSAIVETGDCAEVCVRGNEWSRETPDIPFNMVEFLFRAQENAVGTIGVSVAVREDMRMTK